MIVLLWLFVAFLLRRSDAFNAGSLSGARILSSHHPSPSPRTKQGRIKSKILLSGRRYRPYDDNAGDDESTERERNTERPTQTRTELIRPAIGPSKPKILVLGATGKIGRRVVQTILDMSHLDVTVVAFVRDYDKACRVLYDDLLVSNSRKKGPKLQIVQGDLIRPEELPGYRAVDDDDEEEEQAWFQKAESASVFYGNSVKDYDNRAEHQDIPDEALEDAIRDCTTIISCVGSVRPTNFWTDIMARPLWRLLRKDVSGWCSDPRHPFYVHYQTTRKALNLAEREQLRREAAASCQDEENGDDDKEIDVVPRIRFIRVSDLCVSQPPFHFVPLITNILHSMVFRYQDMAEKTLEASALIETVTLRPGDLVGEERNVNTTTLQVDPLGSVP